MASDYRPYPDDVELMTTDVSAGRWVEEALNEAGFARGVRSIVPDGFPAYVRIFHPACGEGENNQPRRVRWTEVAEWSGQPLDAESRFEDIASGPATDEAWPGDRPREGTLDREQASALGEILRGFTGTPERCWFGLWVGFGWLYPGSSARLTRSSTFGRFVHRLLKMRQRWAGRGQDFLGPTIQTPGREYYLFRGPIEAVLSFCDQFWEQSPNLWWPDDRAWCVATEIDLLSTYVGGTEECIERLLSDDRLETMPTTPEAAFG